MIIPQYKLMTIKKLLEQNGYTSYQIDNVVGIPIAIEIFPSNGKFSDKPAIQVNLEVVDNMSYTHIAQNTPIDAVSCLTETLQKKYGGKNMVSVPKDMVKEVEKLGIKTSPVTPNGESYGRLMQADLAEVKAKFAPQDIGQSKFEIVTDKAELLARAGEISELFLKNAPYAKLEEKQPFYSPAAMAARIDDQNVRVLAVKNKTSDKIIGFVRGYEQENMGLYVSDLVVAEEYRNQRLGSKLLGEAMNSLSNSNVQKLFLIAGDDDKEKPFYAAIGFKSVAETGVTTPLSEGNSFAFVMNPRAEIINDMSKEFAKTLPEQNTSIIDKIKEKVRSIF